MRRLTVVLAVAVFLLALPAPSSAQGYLVPHIGWNFGGSAGNCPDLFSD